MAKWDSQSSLNISSFINLVLVFLGILHEENYFHYYIIDFSHWAWLKLLVCWELLLWWLHVTSVQPLRGFCSGLLMLCVTVGLSHSNTQQCLQAADSVHLESLCCWKYQGQHWTCFSVNLCSECLQYISSQSTPVLSLQAVWSKLCSSPEHKRPDRWWSDVGLAAQSQRLAVSAVHTLHLWRKICWM